MRNRYFLRMLWITGIILVFSACNVKTGNTTSQKSFMKDSLVYVGCQDQLKLVAGNVVILKLEAVKGTGYQWLVKEASPLLQQMNSEELEYAPSENKEVMAGEAGYQILKFKAADAGEGVVQLEYKRSFESGVEKSCTIKFTIGR